MDSNAKDELHQQARVNDQATIDYFEIFADPFTVQVAEVFAWESTLTTQAFARNPFELLAMADFFNTGETVPSVNTPGVMLVPVAMVPLPASLPLIALALASLARLRRRAVG